LKSIEDLKIITISNDQDQDGKPKKKKTKHEDDKRVVITAGENGLLKMWDYDTWKCIKTQPTRGNNFAIEHLLYERNISSFILDS
jgi:hypothetical protein